METNNDSPNPIREDDWDEAAEENYPQELTEVLQAADVAEQLEQAQEEEYTPDVAVVDILNDCGNLRVKL